MNPGPPHDAANKPGGLKALALGVLQGPLQLRVLLLVVMVGGWYWGFSQPMSAEIDETTSKTARERKRVALVKDVERLRAQVDRFQGRLPEKGDANEWIQYLLAGVRSHAVQLQSCDTDGVKDVGPYKAVVMKIQVEGTFEELDRFLRWIEANPRLLRVDSLRLDPSRKTADGMKAQMIVLGIMG